MKVYKGNESGIEWNSIAQTIADWIAQSVKNGDAIVPRTVREIAEQLRQGLCAVVFDDADSVVGYLTTYDLGVDAEGRIWWEVGTGIVPPNMRKHGIGKIMYDYIVTLHPNGVLACTTKNLVALRLSVGAGFIVENYEVVPANIRNELCYTAPCFQDARCGRCMNQYDPNALTGLCYLRVRWPRE